MKGLYVNIRGRLMDLGKPKVMGILNVTPDSFFAGSRTLFENEIRERVGRMVSEGADIIDVGGCSTRPGFEAPSAEEEWERVNLGCEIVKELAPELPLSIDTFRADVARKAIETWNADIINDVSGGKDPEMWPLVAEKQVAYVLTHNPETADHHGNLKTDHSGDITADVITDLSMGLNELHRLGVNDVIMDPGFGFGKTIEENFKLLRDLPEIVRIGAPVLVGVSRKSMIYKTLGVKPEESLTGTIALEAIAVEKGAHILRVHDVKEAKEIVGLVKV